MADSNKHATGSTMSTGDPAPSDRNSLSIGRHGPILLHDVHFFWSRWRISPGKIPECVGWVEAPCADT